MVTTGRVLLVYKQYNLAKSLLDISTFEDIYVTYTPSQVGITFLPCMNSCQQTIGDGLQRNILLNSSGCFASKWLIVMVNIDHCWMRLAGQGSQLPEMGMKLYKCDVPRPIEGTSLCGLRWGLMWRGHPEMQMG